VNIESLIGSYFRRGNRRYLRFSESPTGTGVPPPDPDKQYMLYLHIPYCITLCPFCFFHRFKFRENSARQYFRGLRREIELATDAGYRFGELYVGGGTPTVLPDELIGTINLVRESHPVQGVSVETCPSDLTPELLRDLRGAGVSRLSVGVQSFDDRLLREMQRYEKFGSGEQIRDRLQQANGIFDTLNVDMIFNFPHQTEASLHRDLDILVDELDVDQVSFYPLMAADSKKRSMLRSIGNVDYSRERSLYEIIAGHMLANGYSRSSAWCFSSKPGMFDEYIVEHEEYLGLGSGAFSYLRGALYTSTFSINHYLRLVEGGSLGTVRRRELKLRDQMRYYLLMKLFGGSLDLAAAEDRFAGRFKRTLWPELAALRTMGAMRQSGGKLTLTENGYYLWVMMMREFFTGMNKLREQMRHDIVREQKILNRIASDRVASVS
jgi:coproporphyrinogen III oxidase-like Fe-S oxidoreductase